MVLSFGSLCVYISPGSNGLPQRGEPAADCTLIRAVTSAVCCKHAVTVLCGVDCATLGLSPYALMSPQILSTY